MSEAEEFGPGGDRESGPQGGDAIREEFRCPDCGRPWPEKLEPCSGCGLSWEAVEAAAAFVDQMHALPQTRIWPPGILSRVSREAYNAVGRARGFPFMTPEEREAAARSYDQLDRRTT